MVVQFKFPASTMVIQKELPFTKFLNREIGILRESGIIQQIYEKHAKKKHSCQTEEKPKPIQFKKVIFPFFVYIIGVISALAIFFIENIIVKRNEKVETEQVKQNMENYSKNTKDEVQCTVLHPLPKIISSDSTSITKKSKYSLEKLPGNYEKFFF